MVCQRSSLGSRWPMPVRHCIPGDAGRIAGWRGGGREGLRDARNALTELNVQLAYQVEERTVALRIVKQAESQLRESEERFRQVAEHVQEVFWMTDLETGRLIYSSPAYTAIWGR